MANPWHNDDGKFAPVDDATHFSIDGVQYRIVRRSSMATGYRSIATEINDLVDGCKTPGKKKRSKGKGRGLARGKGKGPIGVPVDDKEEELDVVSEARAGAVKTAILQLVKQAKILTAKYWKDLEDMIEGYHRTQDPDEASTRKTAEDVVEFVFSKVTSRSSGLIRFVKKMKAPMLTWSGLLDMAEEFVEEEVEALNGDLPSSVPETSLEEFFQVVLSMNLAFILLSGRTRA